MALLQPAKSVRVFNLDRTSFFFHVAARKSIMSIESASSSPDLARQTLTYSHVRIGVGHGLSEVDVAQRQRYFENSR